MTFALISAIALHSVATMAFMLWLTLNVQRNRKEIMAAIDDLKAADAAETAEIATVGQALQDEITRIGTITVPVGTSDADVAAITADINTHVQNLQTIATALAGVAAAQPPAPTS